MNRKVIEDKPKLTKKQQRVLDILEERDYNISIKELSVMLGAKTSSSINSLIKGIEVKGYDIRSKIKEKKKEDKENRKKQEKEIRRKKLTPTQQEIYDILIENNYNITNTDIAKRLGKTQQAVSQIIAKIKEKGYRIVGDKPKLTKIQQDVLSALEEYDYSISYAELDKKVGKSKRSEAAIDLLEKKGYKIRENRLGHMKLIEQEEILLSVNEENNYKATLKMVNERGIVHDTTLPRLIKKFSNSVLNEEDTLRVAKFIKHKGKLDILLKTIQSNKKISYNNIRILIDELLKYEEEDKTKAIEFVIEYEKILLDRGMKKVEEPLYQLLVKYNDKIQLTKSQCTRIKDLMDTYEERVKGEDSNIRQIKENEEKNKEEVEIEGLEL